MISDLFSAALYSHFLKFGWQKDSFYVSSRAEFSIILLTDEKQGTLTWWQEPAAGERVPGETLWTGTDRDVVDNVTLSVLAASAGARVAALVAQTGLITWTLRVEYTLWPTSFVGVATVLWDTFAQALTSADSIGSARRGITGVHCLRRRSCCKRRRW